jgi:hypothetical protein
VALRLFLDLDTAQTAEVLADFAAFFTGPTGR